MKGALLPFAVIVVFSACMSNRAVVIDPFEKQSPRDFDVLEIPEFKTTVTEDLDPEILQLIPDRTIEKLRDEGIFREVTRETNQTDGVLKMEGLLVSYETGSRTKRWLLGLGSGKAYCTVQCTFRNKTSGQELAKMNFEGEVAGGLFGGGAKDSAKGVVNAIVDYFRRD